MQQYELGPQHAVVQRFRPRMTGAGRAWYVLMCVAFGAGYLCKVPVKRALEQAGMGHMTTAEHFWYVVENICLGSGYFAKVIAAKALHDVAGKR